MSIPLGMVHAWGCSWLCYSIAGSGNCCLQKDYLYQVNNKDQDRKDM
jgi:hypothetical protein